ncbi:hypothetical protein PV325_008706 [Microctonus aethiopoides]|nr:hypothetical protein PV325_008706 [Microctonus aethiopoides]
MGKLRTHLCGTSNPKVKLYYVNLEEVVSNKGEGFVLKEIEHPPELTNFERILAAVAFPTENLVSATWMNRIQNRAYFHLYNVESLKYNTALAYAEKHGWVEQFSPPHFSRTGMEFLLILPQKQLDNDTWPHLVMVTNATSSTPRIRALTSGTFVVTEIVGWDENNSLV